MSELPLEALESTSIHDRSEALRKIALHGGHDLVERLMLIAQTDKSAAVRLGAAAAAADVLSRYRVGKARKDLPDARRVELLNTFRALDPKVNPGLFLVLSCLDLPRCLERIRVGLRDPRWDVRQGAVVGLRRYCTSASVSENKILRERVLGLLQPEGRLQPDALEGVIGICAEAGWEDAREGIMRWQGSDGTLGGAVDDAVSRLDRLQDPEGLEGAWISLGLDAGEVNANPAARGWFLLTAKGGFTGLEGGALKPLDWKAPEPGSLSLKTGGRWKRVAYRRFWLLRPDTGNAGQALQFGDRTWFKATDEDFPELVNAAVMGGKGQPKEIRTRLAAPLLSLVPDTQAGVLSAARLDVLAGRAKKAIDGLQKVIKAKKKAPAETWFWLGEAYTASRKKPEAKKAFKAYLEKAPKRGAHVEAAQARLDAK